MKKIFKCEESKFQVFLFEETENEIFRLAVKIMDETVEFDEENPKGNGAAEMFITENLPKIIGSHIDIKADTVREILQKYSDALPLNPFLNTADPTLPCGCIKKYNPKPSDIEDIFEEILIYEA